MDCPWRPRKSALRDVVGQLGISFPTVRRCALLWLRDAVAAPMPESSRQRARRTKLRQIPAICGTDVTPAAEVPGIQSLGCVMVRALDVCMTEPGAKPDAAARRPSRRSATDRAQPPLLHPAARPHSGRHGRGHGHRGVRHHLQLRRCTLGGDQLPYGGPGSRGQRPPRRLGTAGPGRALGLCRRPGGQSDVPERRRRRAASPLLRRELGLHPDRPGGHRGSGRRFERRRHRRSVFRGERLAHHGCPTGGDHPNPWAGRATPMVRGPAGHHRRPQLQRHPGRRHQHRPGTRAGVPQRHREHLVVDRAPSGGTRPPPDLQLHLDRRVGRADDPAGRPRQEGGHPACEGGSRRQRSTGDGEIRAGGSGHHLRLRP